MQDFMFEALTDSAVTRGEREPECAFEVDFHAEVVPEVRNPHPPAGLI